MNWKLIYEQTLKKICEKPAKDDETIVDVDFSKISDKLIENENADINSAFRLKLDETATEEDYKTFCELIFNYFGLDIYDFLPKEQEFDNNDDFEGWED